MHANPTEASSNIYICTRSPPPPKALQTGYIYTVHNAEPTPREASIPRTWLLPAPALPGVSYRQLGVGPRQADAIQQHSDVGADHGHVRRKAGDGAHEVSEQHYDAVQLDAEADEGPSQEDEREAAEEGGRAFCFLLPREEEECLLGSDDDGQADKKQDLRKRSAALARARGCSWGG